MANKGLDFIIDTMKELNPRTDVYKEWVEVFKKIPKDQLIEDEFFLEFQKVFTKEADKLLGKKTSKKKKESKNAIPKISAKATKRIKKQ